MIPPFNENGYLPPGVHKASLDEIAQRFGQQSEMRKAQMDSVRWLVDLARRAGIEKVVLNGSFVTAIPEPNDVDCLLLTSDAFLEDQVVEDTLEDGFPFLEIEIVSRREFDYFVQRFFAEDRKNIPKGMIEVIL
jgi:hypothetical protein